MTATELPAPVTGVGPVAVNVHAPGSAAPNGTTDFTNVNLVCFVLTIVQVASSPATNVTAVPTTGVDAPLIVPVHDQDVPATNPSGPPNSVRA